MTAWQRAAFNVSVDATVAESRETFVKDNLAKEVCSALILSK
ncbi:MAG: hypothetical protein VW124_17135 [Paracoccaceae bacterium]|jgi:hypothetical protein